MQLVNHKSLAIISTIVISALLFSACGSEHGHGPTPTGLEILVNGQVVAAQNGTEITYTGDQNSITLNEGDEIVATVQFILESGEPYNYTTEDGYDLSFNNTNQSVVSINHPHNSNTWALMMNGLAEGTAELNFELLHAGHSDFDSRNFVITVSAAGTE